MKCPICNIEAKVEMKPQAIKKGDKYYHRMVYICRDKNCDRYGKEIGTEDIEFKVVEE